MTFYSNKYFKYLFLIVFCFALFFISKNVSAATSTWDGGGATNNWSEAANWSGDVVPTSADNVIFSASSTASSTKNTVWDSSGPASINSLDVQSTYSGTFTLSRDITVVQDWTYNSTSTLNTQTSTLKFSNQYANSENFNFTAGPYSYYAIELGNCRYAAGLTIVGQATTTNLIASGTEEVCRSINSGTLNVTGAITITVASGGGGSGTININGAGDQTLSTAGWALPNVTINKPSGTLYLSGTIPVERNWTWQSGVIDVQTSTLKFASSYYDTNFTAGPYSYYAFELAKSSLDYGVAIVGQATTTNLIVSGVGSLKSGTLNVTGAITITAASSYIVSGTININGAGDQTLSTAGWTLPNVTINKPSGTLYLSGTIPVYRDWLWQSGILDAQTSTLKLTGNYYDTNFTPNISAAYYNLEIAKTTGYSVILGSNLRMTGTLTITSGTFNEGSYTIYPFSPSSLGPSSMINGSWTSSTQPTLSFIQFDPVASNTLQYRIQISTSSSFTSQAVDYTSSLLSQTSTSLFTVGQAVASGTYTVGTSSQTLSDGQYYWRVMSTDNLGATSSYTNASSGVAFQLDATAPTGTIASSTFGTITSSSIIINRPSTSTITESGSGLYQWQVRRNSTTTLSAVSTSTASTSDTSLTSNTQYTYDVRFIDVAGNISSYSASSSKYTLTPTPTNLSITPSQTSNALSVDSFNNASSSSSGYYFSNTTNSNNSGWITTNSWTDTDLTCNTSYTYTIKYRNGDATESATSSVSQTTSACTVSAAVASAGLPISILSPKTNQQPTTNNLQSISTNIPISTNINQYQPISFSNYLYPGLSSPEVKNLQQLLSQYPDIYPQQKITGYFGQLTKQAVQKLQLKYNITNESDSAYGYVGPKTRRVLNLLEQINYLQNQLNQILNQIKKSS